MPWLFKVLAEKLRLLSIPFPGKHIEICKADPSLGSGIQNAALISSGSKSQSWPAGPCPERSFWQSNKIFPWVFAEKPSPSCILFRIWLMWLDTFYQKWNSNYNGNGLAGQFWQMKGAFCRRARKMFKYFSLLSQTESLKRVYDGCRFVTVCFSFGIFNNA